VTEHDHERRIEVPRAVFDRADLIDIRDIPRDAHDKQVADPLVKEQFDRRAGVCAGQNDRKRMLTIGEGVASTRLIGAGMLGAMRQISLTPIDESLERLIG
jgi:hypothetical protein